MKLLSLYCKSYRTDLKRVIRLVESIRKFNQDELDLYISVPAVDYKIFSDHLKNQSLTLLPDEEIIAQNPRIDPELLSSIPGNISQQVVKSEFWRLNTSAAYLCLDSDALFIREFSTNDFMASDGTPYTVINEARDLKMESIVNGKPHILENFKLEAASVQKIFDRNGLAYSYGPMPMVWHRNVWESLEKNYLIPRGLNFIDAISMAPLESRWYGEALLKYQAIPLLPCEPFFKVYHYAWQLDQDQRNGITHHHLAQLYSGVIYQSAWERDMDWPDEGRNQFSRFARFLKRRMGKI